ncbi:MAG TPA: N-acetyl-alpha-D-glucosaminyl L-malate synthase BshA [Candidatus Bathyarchaeia archaeon]|nr:N-acetyl-alpha-D-glucosaminyl L-malate synthase BshA [Candidatus Bathyarchaeia archaeon]
MADRGPLRIGISCFPSVGGSGTLATALGQDLAERGHEVHFICYERPFRLLEDGPRLHFHPVAVNDYDVLKFPDYTLPLSVRMAEVSRDHGLDLLHVHYAVPHATAAILARSMLPPGRQPRVVTTLHGTDTTLLGHDPGYAPAIRYALTCSDAVTAVSASLKAETERVFDFRGPIEVVHNFFVPRTPRRPAAEVRRELGVGNEALVVHSSNLRPGKRIDLLLEAVSRVRPRDAFKLLVLAGEPFVPYAERVRQLGLADRLVVREKVTDIEDYLQVADVGLFTSDTESFCLSILEAMCFGCPSVSTRVGGIPEVVEDNVSGMLVPAGDGRALSDALESLLRDPERRRALGRAARARARELFSAEVIVPRYEALYRRLCR